MNIDGFVRCLALFIPSFRLALRVKKMNRLSLDTGRSRFVIFFFFTLTERRVASTVK